MGLVRMGIGQRDWRLQESGSLVAWTFGPDAGLEGEVYKHVYRHGHPGT